MATPLNPPKNPMWAGRFVQAASDIMMQINASIDIDKRLYRHDIAGSIAHARMLGETGIISSKESQIIIAGLKELLTDIESGHVIFRTDLEDIHMNIEYFLTEKIGAVGGKLHTARSRNDQVTTTLRLWLRDAIDDIMQHIDHLQIILDEKAKNHADTIMPGFTHLQIAQPVTLGMHLGAYNQMLARDHARFQQTRERLNESPLGAGALAGTDFPIDRNSTARELGFHAPMVNTIDSVAARDFVLEFINTAGISMMHLSRLAEELILWSSSQFDYIRLPDDMTSGSSIMPQKKNPDAAELVRAKTAQISGRMMQMMMVMKALPLAYNKDCRKIKNAHSIPMIRWFYV